MTVTTADLPIAANRTSQPFTRGVFASPPSPAPAAADGTTARRGWRVASSAARGGSDLKKRIAAIMGNRVGLPLTSTRKAGLAVVAVLSDRAADLAALLSAPLRASLAGGAAAAAGQKFDVVSIKPCPELRPAAPRAPALSRGGTALIAAWRGARADSAIALRSE